MKRFLLLVSAGLLSWNVQALEVAEIRLADKVQVSGAQLHLNGAGIRSKFFFKIYVGALYLTQKQSSAEAVITDGQVHRVALHMLSEMSSEKLLDAFNEAIKENHTPAELAPLHVQMTMLKEIFSKVKEVKPGDAIFIDFLPGSGTRISFNGVSQGVIPGPSFYRALLKVWLGDKPVQDDLKKAMLGG